MSDRLDEEQFSSEDAARETQRRHLQLRAQLFGSPSLWKNKRLRAFFVIGAITGLIPVVCMLMPVSMRDFLVCATGLLWTVGFSFSTFTYFAIRRKEEADALAELILLDDVCTVGTLAEFLYGPVLESSLQGRARGTLTCLLPRMEVGKPPFLSTYQHIQLYRCLMHRNVDLVLAVLAWIEQAGSIDALPYLRPLIAGTGTGQNPCVRQKAQVCYDLLQERVARFNQPETLLRASQAPAEAPDSLLRPLETHHASKPDELLRVI